MCIRDRNGLIPVVIIYWAYEFLLDVPGLHQLLEFRGVEETG